MCTSLGLNSFPRLKQDQSDSILALLIIAPRSLDLHILWKGRINIENGLEVRSGLEQMLETFLETLSARAAIAVCAAALDEHRERYLIARPAGQARWVAIVWSEDGHKGVQMLVSFTCTS